MSKKKPGGTPTPFEKDWGIQRTGDWSGWMHLRCCHCDVVMGSFTRPDWLRSRRSPWDRSIYGPKLAPDGRIYQIIASHLAKVETLPACLDFHFRMSSEFHRALAKNPSTNPDHLRTIALLQKHGSELGENPVLELLLLEDPGTHREWIAPVLKKAAENRTFSEWLLAKHEAEERRLAKYA